VCSGHPTADATSLWIDPDSLIAIYAINLPESSSFPPSQRIRTRATYRWFAPDRDSGRHSARRERRVIAATVMARSRTRHLISYRKFNVASLR
jgi:hypothetical protein